MEMQVPVILALNMMDVAISHGIHIDSTKLSEYLVYLLLDYLRFLR